MTGTLLDAVVCLLLVSGAVVVVTTTPTSERGSHRAERVATTLATVTDTVSYPVTDERDRTRHGTLSELLAIATVATAAGDDAVWTAVRPVVADALGPRTQVVARWVPYPTAPVRGRIAVGDAPPATTTVRATTFRVPVGDCVTRRCGVGDADAVRPTRVATAILARVLPIERRRLAQDGVSGVVQDRYRSIAANVGLSLSPSDDWTTAFGRLRRALTDRVRRDDPSDTEGIGYVTVVVRTWSA